MVGDFIRNNLRVIAIVVGVIIITLIAYALFTTIEKGGKVEVKVAIVPSDARTLINGQSITPGTSYLAEGEYTVESSKDGFARYNKKTYIDKNNNTIVISLEPESEVAKKWAEENQDAYLANEGISGETTRTWSEAYRQRNPITNILPYSNLLYTIGYKNDPADPSGNTLILTINAASGYRNAAIEKIRSFGYDPTDFNIKFIDYTNPFAS